MKIVMITPDCYMIDRRIILEAKSLIKAGHSVTLLAGFECPKEESYNLEGIEVHRYKYDWDDERLKKIRKLLPNNDKVRMFVNKGFMYLARKIFEVNPFDQFMISKLLQFDADVYHVHDLPCLKAGINAANRKNVPLVYDAHELYYAQDVLPPSLQKQYYKQEKKYIKVPDIVITVNPFIANLMKERYKIEEPNVIMNCTEIPENFKNEEISDNHLKEEGNIPDDWKVVLYQGWISSERNIETIVKSVKYFPPKTCLALIGYGEYVDTLKELAKTEGVSDRVFFLGEIPNNEILKYTRGADLGVIPYRPIDDNHLYCSPNKLFEYVIVGLPVITDKLPFFEFINGKYGFINTTDMGNSKEIGQTINKIIMNKEKLNKLKNNCNKAAEELNWEYEGEKLIKLYGRLYK